MESLDNLKKFYSNKKIFITGHTGFKGAWLSIILSYLNAKIYGYSLAPKKNSLFIKSGIKKKLISNSYADIRNIKDLKKKINLYKPEIVFHLAAQPLVIDSFINPIETFNTNILGTANLLECLRNIKSVKSVIIVTTAGFAFSATSANALLNCRTTEFCANEKLTIKSERMILYISMVLIIYIVLMIESLIKFQK